MRPLLKEPAVQEKKPGFTDLPPTIFRQIAKLTAAKIMRTDVVYGGLSAAACYVMTLDNDRRVFVKGAHPGDTSHGAANLAQEIMTYESLAILADVAPKYIGIVSDGEVDGWMLGVWEYHRNDPALYSMERVLEILPRWQGDRAVEAAMPAAKEHVYLKLFFNGEKKWQRIRNDYAVRQKFLGLFVDRMWAEEWLGRNEAALITQQSRADKLGGPEGLLHGDLRLDNFLFTEKETFVIDWPNASFGPLVFDLAFLFSSLEALGLGRTEEFFSLYTGAKILDSDKAIMLSSLSGYFADHAYRDVPERMPRLRWMQKSMLLAQLKALARLGIVESPPRMKDENQ